MNLCCLSLTSDSTNCPWEIYLTSLRISSPLQNESTVKIRLDRSYKVIGFVYNDSDNDSVDNDSGQYLPLLS